MHMLEYIMLIGYILINELLYRRKEKFLLDVVTKIKCNDENQLSTQKKPVPEYKSHTSGMVKRNRNPYENPNI